MAGKDTKKAVPLLPAVPEDEIRQEVIADDNTRYVLHLRRQVLEQYGKFLLSDLYMFLVNLKVSISDRQGVFFLKKIKK